MRSQHNEADAALRRSVVIAMFAAAAVVLGLIEAAIPFQAAVPGAKLGLGNIMVLACLHFLRGRDAISLIVLKTVITSLLLGTFSSFLFSIAGGLLSFAVMYALLRLGRDRFSLIGVSVAGGIAHNIGQLTAATFVLGTSKIFYYLPFLMVAGIATGIFVGFAAKTLIRALGRLPLFESLENPR
ncbi:Gx transporter family protein [Paenibacillus antri]|uniref:Gx transporter family protein n=1 Tax=Paenibacillus antri TaxID=2582848 RepID=A0A5R9FX29_9BACL|nr:Gx transporter family protein [Paenibacillus antri]TLS48572.1 Gx transporter family protein [Paenibacillus antri]